MVLSEIVSMTESFSMRARQGKRAAITMEMPG